MSMMDSPLLYKMYKKTPDKKRPEKNAPEIFPAKNLIEN